MDVGNRGWRSSNFLIHPRCYYGSFLMCTFWSSTVFWGWHSFHFLSMFKPSFFVCLLAASDPRRRRSKVPSPFAPYRHTDRQDTCKEPLINISCDIRRLHTAIDWTCAVLTLGSSVLQRTLADMEDSPEHAAGIVAAQVYIYILLLLCIRLHWC